MSIPRLILGVQLVVDLDVEITLILGVGFVCEIACHAFAFLDGKNFAKIKNSLLPVRVFGMRTSRESNGFMTSGKVNVEPGDKGVNKVVSLATEAEGRGKCEVSGCDRVEIDCEYRARISDKGFHLDCVHQWLGQSVLLHWRKVEAVDIVPNCNR